MKSWMKLVIMTMATLTLLFGLNGQAIAAPSYSQQPPTPPQAISLIMTPTPVTTIGSVSIHPFLAAMIRWVSRIMHDWFTTAVRKAGDVHILPPPTFELR
jgi:hypothetical protein